MELYRLCDANKKLRGHCNGAKDMSVTLHTIWCGDCSGVEAAVKSVNKLMVCFCEPANTHIHIFQMNLQNPGEVLSSCKH